MRPVNLIPAEERRGKGSVRTGSIAYLLVGALALALGAVILLVLTNNTISDRKAEIAGLEQQAAAARARAEQLAPFANFSSVEQARRDTIRSLADSRFDWERVLRELALVMPSDIWLTELNGSVSSAAASASGEASTDTSSSIAGPSLMLTGCGAGQNAVAGFLSALRDIDGVTRVGLTSSERPTGETTVASSDSGAGGGDADCRTRDFIAKFEIVAAFDEVPAPQIPGAAPAAPAPAPAAPAATPPADAESTPAANTGS
ncbi:MAG: hypothetical protein ACRDKV_07515 [Solirubrobacterales bacterium]